MLRKCLFCLLMWLPITAGAANEPHNQHIPSCEIPGNDVVVRYDLLSAMPRSSGESQLIVQSDRKIILGNPYGLSQGIEKQINQMQLQQLLDFIVKKNRFFDIDVIAIQKQIREELTKTGRLFAIADAGESVIRVCSGKHQKEVKFYALSHAARQFPEISALQRLYAIEQELKRTATWVRIGGDEGAQSVLALVNGYLLRKHPDIEPLTLKNLNTAVSDADGNLTVYFSRRGFEQLGARMRNISAITYHPSGHNAKPTVTVNLE